MFGTLGGSELLLILVIALIVFGPRKLPEIGKSIGKMMVEFRKASNDFKQTIESEVEAEKLKAALQMPPMSPAEGTTKVIDPPAATTEGGPASLVESPEVPPPGTVSVDPHAAAADSVPVSAGTPPTPTGEPQ